MKFLDLKDISERYMGLINPTSPEKVINIGRFAGFEPGDRVIDFGCGFGEPLALWTEYFGIRGVGIDIREYACQRASQRLEEAGYADRFEIVCASGSEYQFEPHSFDAAVCLGASFIFGGFLPTVQALQRAIQPEGKLIIGEPYWLKQPVPDEYLEGERGVLTEFELLQVIRREGFDLGHVVRASLDDWDSYESGNWYGLLRWIEENPGHSELQQVIDHLHQSQDQYLRFGREYLGWAIYLLNPIRYKWRL